MRWSNEYPYRKGYVQFYCIFTLVIASVSKINIISPFFMVYGSFCIAKCSCSPNAFNLCVKY